MATKQKGKGRSASTLNFDLSKPIKHGTLLKQGAFHKAFKYRFFVLYPGFLVYYEEQTKWKLDVTRGDTMQSRQGAIKLRNGTCNIAKQQPKGCKFGLIVHAPDPQNKRPTYLINAASKEDRDMWVEAIKQSTPHSPAAARKNDPAKTDAGKKDPKIEENRPKYIIKQETCDAAATVATQALTDNVDEKVTDIDKEISGVEPSMSVRRDTTNAAALLSIQDPVTADDVFGTSTPAVSIDDALGHSTECNDTVTDILDVCEEAEQKPVENDETISEAPVENGELSAENPLENGETVPETPVENGDVKLTECSDKLSQDSVEMETELNVSELKTSSGTEITTSVYVVLNSDGKVVSSSENEEIGDNERGENNQSSAWDSSEGKAPSEESATQQTDSSNTEQNNTETVSQTENSSQSTEIIIPATDERYNNSFTINANNLDSDSDSSDDEEQPTEAPAPSEPVSLQEQPTEAPSPSSSVSLEEQPTEAPSPSSPVSLEEQPTEAPVENRTTPSIIVEETEEPKGIVSNGIVVQNGDAHDDDIQKLSFGAVRKNHERRPSAAFIQKVGFLYKLGGHRKNWKLRYFVLNPGMFFYYKTTKTSTKPLGEVKLKNSRIYFPTSGERKTSFQFCIHTESQWNKRPEWTMAAQSEREMKEWIDAFKAAAGSPITTPIESPTGSDAEN